MEHQDIEYMGNNYSLQHLAQTRHTFMWKGPDGSFDNYTAWVRYSNHCYSRSADQHEDGKGTFVVQRKPLRLFCSERFGETHRLVEIVEKMFSKPTTSVGLTHVGNYHVFQLFTKGGESSRYCVFFGVKNSKTQPVDGSSVYLDVHIESAYFKDQRVGVKRTMPLGNAAYLIRNGEL